MDGIRIEMSDWLQPNGAALRRHPHPGPPVLVKIGSVAEVMEAYRPGDLVLVGENVWHGLQAQFAKNVTPDRALSPLPAAQGGR
ncbi:hypothetical protein [Methylobacterium sp. Leaf106]|uniref:hypothetical protein n=1 Tax=Methylobacterium sp. Leaf106 TaxID=1736255 RepID=UPI000A9DC3C7|nr:hypothetical protein [Methylobacterium sp. Leaf106]